MISKLEIKMKWGIIVGNIILSTIIILVLTLFAGKSYWKYMIYETSPLAWYQSMLLFSSFFILLLKLLNDLLREIKIKKIWVFLTTGFLYLTLDDKFSIHERIRERFLKPQNVKIDALFWVENGDYLLLFLMVIGLAFIFWIVKVLKEDKFILNLFIVGVIVAVMAVLLDSIDLKGKELQFQYILQYLEESFETYSMALFFNVFLIRYLIENIGFELDKGNVDMGRKS